MHESREEVKELAFFHVISFFEAKQEGSHDFIHSLNIANRINFTVEGNHSFHQVFGVFVLKLCSSGVEVDDMLIRQVQLDSLNQL